MDITSTARLNNGVEIPWLGLGVYKAAAGMETRNAVRWAIEAGYRHVDTAAFYANEASVAEGISDSGVNPGEIFVTTKLWNDDHGYDRALAAFDRSRKLLQRDVVDLYLIHWPIKDIFLETWRALEKLYADGLVRAIGVSNFLIPQLEQLMDNSEVPPAVNQVEWHPRVLQRPLLEFCKEHAIQFQAWSPLGRATYLDDPTISQIASRHARSPAQVLIRWGLEHAVVTIPKSVHQQRIIANSQVFDFRLSPQEVSALDALDRNQRLGPHPDQIGA